MNPLDRPVKVSRVKGSRDPLDGTRADLGVRPSDVLAALDEEQHEAMVQRIIPEYARIERLSPRGGRVHAAAHALIAALCDEAAKTPEDRRG